MDLHATSPGRTFAGGKVQIAFDADCRGTAGLAEQLDRIAGAKIVHPNIDYRKGKDGHIVKLADQLPKDTKARALFKAPRQDFPVAAQAAYLKVADGSTALVGLVRGDASGLAAADAGGTKTVNVSIAASVVGADGNEAGWMEQTMNAPVGPDGAFVGSFKLGLKPGKYTLKAGAVDLKGGKASLASMPIEVPDLCEGGDGGGRHHAPGALGGVDHPAAATSRRSRPSTRPTPLTRTRAFNLAQARLIPLFGTTLHKADQLSIFYQVYDLAVDAAGKADAMATVSILKDGKAPIASTQNPMNTAVGGSVIGPVPLAGYELGQVRGAAEGQRQAGQEGRHAGGAVRDRPLTRAIPEAGRDRPREWAATDRTAMESNGP